MKTQKIYSPILFILLFAAPLLASTNRSDNERSKEIIEEFDVNNNSNVYFKHRRGTLTVKHIQEDKGRIEAIVKVKGDDVEDIQRLLDEMTVEVTRENGQIEIRTANKIV